MDFYRQKDIVFIPIQYIQKKRANYENIKDVIVMDHFSLLLQNQVVTISRSNLFQPTNVT